MSKQFLSRFHIGNAKLDLILDRDTFRMGETATGKIHVQSSLSGETIKGLEVEFRVNSRYKDKQKQWVYVDELIGTLQWDQELVLVGDEHRELDFRLEIPEWLPVSSLNTRYYLKTNFDVRDGRVLGDFDEIHLLPVGLTRNFLEGLEALGCKVVGESYFGNKRSQGFCFKNMTWLAGKLDELEFNLFPFHASEELRVFYEVERKTDNETIDDLDLNEAKGYHSFSLDDLATVEKAADSIKRFVEAHYLRLPS